MIAWTRTTLGFAVLSVIALLLLPAGMRRQSILEMSQVIGWTPGECSEAADWVAEWDFGSGWLEAKPGGRTIAAGDCMAYLRGLNIGWRACCVCKEGRNCVDEAGNPAERLCEEAAQREKFPFRCETIYNLTGGPFDQSEIDEWNEDHYQEPTPTPVPTATAEPTAVPTPTVTPSSTPTPTS